MAMLLLCSLGQHCSVRSWLMTTGWVIVFTWLLNTASLVDALWCVLTCNRDLHSSNPFQWVQWPRTELHTLPGSPMPPSIRMGAWWLFGFPGINLEYVSNSPSNVWIVTIPLGITTEINGPRSLLRRTLQWLQTCHSIVGPILLRTLPLLYSVGSSSESCSGLEGHRIMTFIRMAALSLLTTAPCFLVIPQTEWYPCWLLICLVPLNACTQLKDVRAKQEKRLP